MVRVLGLPVFRARSRFPAQKRSLFSVNALVVISQEPSVYAGLRDSGLLRNDTCRKVIHNHGASDGLAKQVT